MNTIRALVTILSSMISFAKLPAGAANPNILFIMSDDHATGCFVTQNRRPCSKL